jgi:integrase
LKRPWIASGFRAVFFKLIRALVGDYKVSPGLTIHGLRHTVGDELAELGFSSRDIADYLADRSEAMGKHYSAGAGKRHRVVKMTRALERKWGASVKPRRTKCKTSPGDGS